VAGASHPDKWWAQNLAPFSDVVHVPLEINVEEFENKVELGVGVYNV